MAPPSRTDQSLRLMTYNVHSCRGLDRRHDVRRVADVIAGCEPDIVALQELDVMRRRTGSIDQAHALAELLGMRFHFHAALNVEEEKFGNAILTRRPERLVKAAALPTGAGRETRSAIWVSVRIPGGHLQVINTHLGLSPIERLIQMRCLLSEEWLDHEQCRDPVILLGDLNTGRLSRAYRMLRSRLKDAPQSRWRRPPRTFPSRRPLLRIDHVFCSSSIRVIDAGTASSAAARIASDHLPVVVDISLPGASMNASRNDRRLQGLHASAAPSGSPR